MIEVIENAAVSEIVMGNPPVNAIDNKFMSDFHAALDRVEDVGATVMLIRSNQKVFCAGADLKSIQQHFQSDSGIDDMITYVQLMHKLFNRLEQFPVVLPKISQQRIAISIWATEQCLVMTLRY